MEAEKIICCDRGNDNALAYAAMANNRRDAYDPTAAMKFAPCVTDEDKWVAFNATFADLCKVLTLEQIVAAAHAFWFADKDAPCDKIHRYVVAMSRES